MFWKSLLALLRGWLANNPQVVGELLQYLLDRWKVNQSVSPEIIALVEKLVQLLLVQKV